jgi:hypothetical protein
VVKVLPFTGGLGKGSGWAKAGDMASSTFGSGLKWAIKQPSIGIALGLWVLFSVAAIALSGGHIPLEIPGVNAAPPMNTVIRSSVNLIILLLLMGLVALIARRRAVPDLAGRAPERRLALRETIWMWVYGAIVLLAGQAAGRHFFGEGIGLHLNGSLFGATRVQSPAELYAWAAYNGVFLALIPYVAFRMRGYSREALNLRSANWKNDTLIIFVLMGTGLLFELMGPNMFQLTRHQQMVGGLLTFGLHLAGTDLPIMIFIYAILLPRYARLASPATAYLLGAASYPLTHVFEYWTRYDSVTHGAISVIFVFLTFFPPGLVKSYLTMRTGNAWVHMWGFHAISPHVMVDTRLVVRDLNIW